MFRRAAFSFAIFVFAATTASAQSRWQRLEANIRHSAGDAWDVWTSPLRATPGDWLVAAGVLATGAAISPLDDNVDRWAYAHREDKAFNFLDPVRAGGAAFSGKTITPVAVGALAVSVIANSGPMEEGIFGCATSYAASSVVRTFVLYPLVARTRPDDRSVPNGTTPPAKQGDQYHFDFPGSSDWGRHSFPGGHMANITACTSFLTQRYHMGYAEPALWALVGGVAVARTLDRAHWVSDEVVGAAFGFAVGREVALRSLRRNEKNGGAADAHGDDGLFLAPAMNGMALGFKRSF